MRCSYYSFILISLYALPGLATTKDAVIISNIVLEEIEKSSFLNRPMNLECGPQGDNRPRTLNELIDYMCGDTTALKDDATLKKELSELGIEQLVAPHSIDDLIKSFRVYHEFNASIPETFNVSSTNDWKLGDQNMTQYPCRYTVKKESTTNFHQMDFKNVSFIGSTHFKDMKKPEVLGQARADLDAKLKSVKPSVLLVEGKEFGQPIACDAVFRDALSEDAALNSEMRATIKYGFWNQIPLIPADNQKIDDIDLAFFDNNEFAKNEAIEKFTFLDTLHLYQNALTQNKTDALKLALQNSNNKMTEEEFKAYYMKVNQRELPSTPIEVKNDFSPSVVAGPNQRATNKIADYQNEIRNKALLKAIQISSAKFPQPAVVGVMYGSGHLGQIGESLEKYLDQEPKNIDFDSACK